jgi:WD40 repeat protein
VKVYDIESGQLARTLDTRLDGVFDVMEAPDGNTLIVAGSGDSAVQFWDLASWKQLQDMPPSKWSGRCRAAAVSPDGTWVAASLDGEMRLANLPTRTEKTLPGLTAGSEAIAFSRDSRRLVAGGLAGEVIVWDTATGAPLLRFEDHTSYVFGIGFTADGRYLASSSHDRTLIIRDADPWE